MSIRTFCICLFTLAFAPAAFAQSEIGGASLNGTVADPSGASVPAAKVTVTNPATGFTRATETSDIGSYNFGGLPVGSYDLSVDAKGFKATKRTAIPLQVGSAVTLDVKLEVGSAQETVSVAAEVPVVETTRTSAASNVTEKAVANLPVNGRNFIDFTLLTPGVVRDNRNQGDIAFAGQRGTWNTLLVDGADSNNLFFGQATGRTGFRPYAFSEDAVQEFQVNTVGYPAEMGRAGGGAINVVTRSGSNLFHGSAFEFYRDKGMNANTFVNNRSGAKKGAYHFNQFGGTFGGPVKKDKLFFFVSYDGQRNTSNQIIVPNIQPTGAALAALSKYLAPYPLGLNNNLFLGKADWNVSQNGRFSVRYNMSRYTGTNFESNSQTSAQEHTGNNQVNTDNLAAVYTRVIGSRLVWDLRFNYVDDKEPGLANASGPEVAITNGITFGKNNFSPRYTNAYTYQPITTLSYQKGAHAIKFGADLNWERVENFFPGFFAGGYTFASYDAFLAGTPSLYRQGFAAAGSTQPPISHPNVNESAFFVQDNWRATQRLTINLGLRYDYFGYNQPTTLNNNPALIAANLKTNRIPTDKTNIGPRLGLAYKPFNDEKTVVRASYGIFYARTPGLLLSTAILQNGIDVLTYSVTSNFPAYPGILTAPPANGPTADIYVTDPNYKTPRLQQWNFQVERALGGSFALTAGYLGVHGTHLTRSRDLNLYPSELTTGTVSNGGTMQYFRHPGAFGSPLRPNAAFGRITDFESGGSSSYNGAFLQLTKRFSRNFQMLSTYTWSKVIDTAPDATAVVPGSDDSKLVQDTLLPNLDRGPGVNDIRHRFTFSAVWDLDYARSMSNAAARALFSGWTLSSIAQVQSGRAMSVTTSGDPGNDTNTANDRAPLIGRGTLSGPGLAAVDLRITRDIPLYKERARLRLIVESFNLTNRANFQNIQTNLYTFSRGVFTPTTNYLVPQTNQPEGIGARALQLAAKITF